MERIVRDAGDLKAHGVGFAAICSKDAEAYPTDSFVKMADTARAKRFPFPYPHDGDQSVARAWGAACTAGLFGLNARPELRYRARLDASLRDPLRDDMPRELFGAMVLVARIGKGPDGQIPSNWMLGQVDGGLTAQPFTISAGDVTSRPSARPTA